MKDEALEELREMRQLASARFDHDLDRYIAHLREGERQHPEQIRAYAEIERQRRDESLRESNSESLILREDPKK